MPRKDDLQVPAAYVRTARRKYSEGGLGETIAFTQKCCPNACTQDRALHS